MVFIATLLSPIKDTMNKGEAVDSPRENTLPSAGRIDLFSVSLTHQKTAPESFGKKFCGAADIRIVC
jgi:hypothetical protein